MNSSVRLLTSSDSPQSSQTPKQLLINRFRCDENIGDFIVRNDLSRSSGFFRIGTDLTCFGQCSGSPALTADGTLYDAQRDITLDGTSVQLPFDPASILDNLRCERYLDVPAQAKKSAQESPLASLYYRIRPLLPVSARRQIQRVYFRGWRQIPFPKWPVDTTVEALFELLMSLSMKSAKTVRVPFIWFWPDGAPSCTVMTHDVETKVGRDYCTQLMDLDDAFGIKASFQIVPEQRYEVPESFLENIRDRGFEVNIHDLNHDGRLMWDQAKFQQRAEKINEYARRFDAQGFRAGIMYRNADWYDALDFSYDMSVPNVAHLEPQQGGCCTVLPYFIGNLVELPLTTTQDYSLFNILNDFSTRRWEDQIHRIRRQNGLISFIVHPDYNIDQKARRVYLKLLQHLAQLRTKGETWIALPRDVVAWWRMRSELRVVGSGASLRIEGKGKERARIAYAVLKNDTLTYELSPAMVAAGSN